jgi:hypothetical protein
MARAYAIARYKKRTVWALGLLLLGAVGCYMVHHYMILDAYTSIAIPSMMQS